VRVPLLRWYLINRSFYVYQSDLWYAVGYRAGLEAAAKRVAETLDRDAQKREASR
jgi:hypothetical protein